MKAPEEWLHFAGVGGSGMSALAQYHRLAGGRATGSDRDFDRGGRAPIRAALEALGVEIHPQDGSGLSRACDGVVASTAVESTVPDIERARELRVPLLHRSELLARYVAGRRAIAVTGTSGKSTTVAMTFAILRGAGRHPSLLTGGNLVQLQEEGYLGNAWADEGELLVVEADESDGSLVRYAPWIGAVLNLRRDHKEPEQVLSMFRTFRDSTAGPFLLSMDPALDGLADGRTRFGIEPGAEVRAEAVELGRDGSSFTLSGTRFTLPAPGLHNVRNAVAAAAICREAGVGVQEMVGPLAEFKGVARRFRSVGLVGGVEVIDDFAHNPDKIAAALETAKGRGLRVLAVFQPHGFAPTRFVKDELIETFARAMRPEDRLWLPEIYYAGGTVTRDISSRDIVDAVAAAGVTAAFEERRADLIPLIAGEARPGDVVMVMGARDPSLTDFCRAILDQLR